MAMMKPRFKPFSYQSSHNIEEAKRRIKDQSKEQKRKKEIAENWIQTPNKKHFIDPWHQLQAVAFLGDYIANLLIFYLFLLRNVAGIWVEFRGLFSYFLEEVCV